MAHLPLDDLEFSAARLIPVGEDVESESDGGERVSQLVAEHGQKIVPGPHCPEECARFRDARPLTREMSCANSGFTVLCGTLLRSKPARCLVQLNDLARRTWFLSRQSMMASADFRGLKDGGQPACPVRSNWTKSKWRQG